MLQSNRYTFKFFFLNNLCLITLVITSILIIGTSPPLQEDILTESEIMFFGEATIVTVSKYSESLKHAGGVVSIITKEEIKKFGFKTLSEILKYIPGYFIESDESKEIIYTRGLKDSILILIDGVPLAFQGDKDNYPKGFDLSLDFIERIEILRGPGSTLWGVNAFSGTVNIITKKGERTNLGESYLELGSFGYESCNLQLGNDLNFVNFFFSFSYKTSQGEPLFLKDAPVIFDLESQEVIERETLFTQNNKDWFFDLYGKVSIKDLTISLRYNDFKDYIPISSFSNSPLSKDENSIRKNPSFFTQITYDHLFNKSFHIVSQGYIATYKDNSIVRLFHSSYPLENHKTGGAFIFDADNQTLGGEVRFDYSIFYFLTGVIGTSYITNYSNRKSFIILPDEEINYYPETKPNFLRESRDSILSFYLQERVSLFKRIFLTFGLRYDKPNEFEASFSPKGGVIFDLDNFIIKILYGEATQSPDIFDLEGISAGIVEGKIKSVQKDSSLKPEKIKTLEGEIGYSYKKLVRFSTNLYYSQLKDLIVEQVKEDKSIQPYNQEKGRFFGIDSELILFENRNLKPFLTYTFQKNLDKILGLYEVPSHIATFGFISQIKENFSLSFYSLFVSERYIENSSNFNYSSYLLSNFSILYTLSKDSCYLSFDIKNIFDTSYYNRNDDLPIQGEGRNFFVKWVIHF